MKENREAQPIPGYVPNEQGELVRHDEFGAWKLLDIEDGHLITLNTFVIMQRAMNRARVMKDTVRIPAKYI